MEIFAGGLSIIASLFSVAMILAGVMKLFQIHSTLLEIQTSLQTRAVPPVVGAAQTMRVPVAPSPMGNPGAPVSVPVAVPEATAQLYSMGSGEDMLRALDLQMKAEDAQGLTPEVYKPR